MVEITHLFAFAAVARHKTTKSAAILYTVFV